MDRSFADRVHAVVRGIPRGETLSYGEVARRAGFPGAARAVGTLMAKNFDNSIHCHRVICGDGRVGQYNRGETPDRGVALKIAKLKSEGVRITNGRVMQ